MLISKRLGHDEDVFFAIRLWPLRLSIIRAAQLTVRFQDRSGQFGKQREVLKDLETSKHPPYVTGEHKAC